MYVNTCSLNKHWVCALWYADRAEPKPGRCWARTKTGHPQKKQTAHLRHTPRRCQATQAYALEAPKAFRFGIPTQKNGKTLSGPRPSCQSLSSCGKRLVDMCTLQDIRSVCLVCQDLYDEHDWQLRREIWRLNDLERAAMHRQRLAFIATLVLIDVPREHLEELHPNANDDEIVELFRNRMFDVSPPHVKHSSVFYASSKT